MIEEGTAFAGGEMIAVLDGGSRRSVGEQPGKRLLASFQRHVAQIVSVEVEEIEGEVDEAARRLVGQGLLQCGEVADALVVEHHDLAVDDRLAAGQGTEALGEVGVSRGPVEAAAGRHPYAVAGDERDRTVAVELDFVQPAVALRGIRCAARELRREPCRHVRPDGSGDPARSRGAAPCRLWRPTGGSRIGEFLDAPPRFRAFRAFGEDVGAFPRGRVAFLEQEPVSLRLARLGLEAGQHEAAVQFLAGQPELEGSGGQRAVDVVHRRPDAGVPDDHRSGAVGPLGDDALEVDILDGMVFRLDGEALVVRVERGSLRHGPALEDPVCSRRRS